MARIRQQYPQNYGSSTNINTEFESLIRYLVTAELGGKTLGETLRVLFDSDGNFAGPIELRRTADAMEYRVGTYTDPSAGWVQLATTAELRGMPGVNLGEVGSPVFVGRADYVATEGQTVLAYAHDADDDILVFKNGLLQVKPGDYTNSAAGDTITFAVGLTAGDKVSAFRVRAPLISGYRRSDITTVSSQQVFAFEHNEDDKLQVYQNGILLREGGSFDYTRQPLNSTITLTAPIAAGNTISIIYAENSSSSSLTGLMLEDQYVDPLTGLINLNAIALGVGGIAQDRVASLPADLGARARLTISATAPGTPASGWLWMDTSATPNQLKFYDGTQWLRTSPETSLPTFSASNSGQYVKVNGTGTALTYGAIDLSSAIPVTARGAANGVAALDSQGRLPFSQLPSVLASESLYQTVSTPANQAYAAKRIYRQRMRIDGIALLTASGACSVQVAVDGVGVGPVYEANASGLNAVIGTPIEVDSSSVNRLIGFIVSANAAAASLEVVLAATIVSS